MATEWIKIDADLPDHIKVKRLARRLGDLSFPGQVRAIGLLIRLWCWTARNAESGALPADDLDIVAEDCGWPGDPDEFFDALVSTGWLDLEGGLLTVHDWDEWQGSILRRRVFSKLRARARRGASGIEAGPECAMCGSDDRLAVDHIVPIARGGDNSPENLRTLCRNCNSEKGSKLDLEWILWQQGEPYARG